MIPHITVFFFQKGHSDIVYPGQDLHGLLPIGAFHRIGLEHRQVDLGICHIIGEDYHKGTVPAPVEARSPGVLHHGGPVAVGEMVDVVEPVEVTASTLAVCVQVDHVLVVFRSVTPCTIAQMVGYG